MNLAAELDDALALTGKSQLTPEVADEIADDIGASPVQVYAAAANLTEIACDASDPIRFELCIGSCQGWGAAELLGYLLKEHRIRREEGAPTFGVVAKRCLDKCENAAVVFVHTPDGKAGLREASVDDLKKALEQLLA